MHVYIDFVSISEVTSSCSISLNVGIVICIVSSVSVRPVNKIAKKKIKKINFPANTSKEETSIMMNSTAPSLYSALHSEVTKTWAADPSTIKTPPNIDKSCLVQGFNMLGPHPMVIKSRIGVETQPQSRCSLPYLVRGVGIGLQGFPDLSCGEIIISNQSYVPSEVYTAVCKIYIQ